MKTIILYENRYTDSLMKGKIRYTEDPLTDDFNKIEIEIPDFVLVYKNTMDNICLGLGETIYLLNELLVADADCEPVIKWTDGSGDHFCKLAYKRKYY